MKTTHDKDSEKPRVKLACAKCRARKVSCSEEKPCSRCVKAGIECTEAISKRGAKRFKENEDILNTEASNNNIEQPTTTDNKCIPQNTTLDSLAFAAMLSSKEEEEELKCDKCGCACKKNGN